MSDHNNNEPKNNQNQSNTNSTEGVLKGEEKLLLKHDYDGIQELDHLLPRWWVWMFYGTILFSAWYVGYYMSGWGPTPAQELAKDLISLEMKKASNVSETADQPQGDEVWLVAFQDAAKIEAGKQVYGNRCMPCHGDKGQGIIGPNLTDEYWINGQGKISEIAKSIITGFPDKGMPPWEQILTPEEMKNLVAFVFTLKGKNVSGGKEPQGNKIDQPN